MTARTYASVFGGLFLALGLLGFVPALWESAPSGPPLRVNVFHASLFGLFASAYVMRMRHDHGGSFEDWMPLAEPSVLWINTLVLVLASGAMQIARNRADRDELGGVRSYFTLAAVLTLLFLAGHGVNDGPDYLFLPTDAKTEGGGWDQSTVVNWEALQGAIETSKGRRIMLVDTCHSGNAYNQRLGNAAYHANIVAYTAARFDQEAMEDPSLGHGLFTYAVVEGLEGKAMVAPRGEISTQSLAGYIVERVGAMAKALKGEQVPQYFKGRDALDFVLAR